METRDFHLGVILSITADVLVAPGHMRDVKDILEFITGVKYDYNVELPTAARQCKPHLLQQHPQLAAVDASGVNEENWREWLAEQVSKYGEQLPVSPIPTGENIGVLKVIC